VQYRRWLHSFSFSPFGGDYSGGQQAVKIFIFNSLLIAAWLRRFVSSRMRASYC